MESVFVLIQEIDQFSFVDQYGEGACPSSSIMGIYRSREKAENEMKHMKENEDTSYYIEERPLL